MAGTLQNLECWGKVGNSGVSIATCDDAKRLYSGFDLCNPNTSVSMTINGPAPIILAFYLNAAIDQQVEAYLKEQGKTIEMSDAATAVNCPKVTTGLALLPLVSVAISWSMRRSMQKSKQEHCKPSEVPFRQIF